MLKKYKIEDVITDALDFRINSRTMGTLCYARRNLKKLLDIANSGIGPSYFLYDWELHPKFSVSQIYSKTGDCFKVKSVDTHETKEYPFIIFAKDMETPFRNKSEFKEAYIKSLGPSVSNTLFVLPSQTFAIWVVKKKQKGKKNNYGEFLVSAIYEDGVCLNKKFGKKFYNWNQLLKNYEFPDGSICGIVPRCIES